MKALAIAGMLLCSVLMAQPPEVEIVDHTPLVRNGTAVFVTTTYRVRSTAPGQITVDWRRPLDDEFWTDFCACEPANPIGIVAFPDTQGQWITYTEVWSFEDATSSTLYCFRLTGLVPKQGTDSVEWCQVCQ